MSFITGVGLTPYGGKYVEAMPDVQVLLSPFSDSEVKAALARLRIAPLLTGVRGEPRWTWTRSAQPFRRFAG